MSNEATIDGVRQYCAHCYGVAAKAGRVVRKVEGYKYPLCSLCESRCREGLIHYSPSNGTEFSMLESVCERCRHFDEEGLQDASVQSCKWNILDKLLNGQFSEPDSMNFWFDPSDIDDGCPATCKRFTDRDDEFGHFRDPPPPDCVGQMTLGEMLSAVKPSEVLA